MTDKQKSLPEEIRFDYLKSNSFKVIHADGIFGGVSHRGTIWATFWSERGAIPTQVVHRLTPDGKLGEELLEQRAVRDAIIREAEAVVVMDLGTAKALRRWLDEKITTVEAATRTEANDE